MVPKTVESKVEATATMRLLRRASIMASFWNISPYQRRLKPDQLVTNRDALKENTMRIRMGT